MIDMSSVKLWRVPTSVRLCISFALATLGIGYLVAMFNLYLTYSLTDGQPGLTINDLKRAFYGNRDNTRLAAKIHGGSMEQFLAQPGEKERILSWIQDGTPKEGYELSIVPIIQKNCVRCHSPAGISSFRPLTSYEEVITVVQIDRGEPVGLWARVAHTHIQSIGLMFLALGVIFSFTSIPDKLKSMVVAIAFLSPVVDFGSRYLARYYANFVYLMVLAGATMGLSIALMILVPLYEMWIRRD